MKRILLGAALLGLAGCSAEQTTVKVEEPAQQGSPERVFTVILKGSMSSGKDIHVSEIDGCEYLANTVHSGIALAHKGNCKYCLERGKK